MPTDTANDPPPSPHRPQPVLETSRLRIRPFVANDGPAVERLAGDRVIADTTQNIPHPYPPGAAAEWIAGHPGMWASGAGASFAITDRTTDAVLGGIGLVMQPINASAELGYWIAAPYWHRGYATEAARAVVALAFDLGVHRVQARHLVRNPASGAVLLKLGMTREGVMREAAKKWGLYEDIAMYGLLEREFVRDLTPIAPSTPHA